MRDPQSLIAPVVGNVVALDEDAAWNRLENEVEKQLRWCQIGAHDGHRHGVRDEGLARSSNPPEDIVDALVVEFRQSFVEQLADEIASSEQFLKRLICDREAKVGAFDKCHEAGRPLEHQLELLVLAAQVGDLLQHRGTIQ